MKYVVDGEFLRRLPIFGKDGDPSSPTGEIRQIQHKLKPDKAG